MSQFVAMVPCAGRAVLYVYASSAGVELVSGDEVATVDPLAVPTVVEAMQRAAELAAAMRAATRSAPPSNPKKKGTAS